LLTVSCPETAPLFPEGVGDELGVKVKEVTGVEVELATGEPVAVAAGLGVEVGTVNHM
jgi:hypothetical protein